MKGSLCLLTLLLGLTGLAPFGAAAQPIPAGQLAPASEATSTLSEGQLDQLTAPIALYPDPLVGAILMAATYPLEIVEADRWLQEPGNAALTGDELSAALQQQSWDMSVKSLVPFPQILQMMDSDLEWTERIGDAFLAQQDAVMDSIQRLRQRAAGAGSLTSTPQEMIVTQDEDIDIEPADSAVVYVPCYDPSVVYGAWPWPDYPPLYLLPLPGDGICGTAWIGFPIIARFWVWNHWRWRHHELDVVAGPSGRMGPWQHDPAHRHGVPYRSAAVSARYQAESGAARRDVRGFPAATEGTEAARSTRAAGGAPQPAPARAAAPSVRQPAPAFESFGSGSEVRQEEARGAFSRSAPAPRSAPSSRGGGSRPR